MSCRRLRLLLGKPSLKPPAGYSPHCSSTLDAVSLWARWRISTVHNSSRHHGCSLQAFPARCIFSISSSSAHVTTKWRMKYLLWGGSVLPDGEFVSLEWFKWETYCAITNWHVMWLADFQFHLCVFSMKLPWCCPFPASHAGGLMINAAHYWFGLHSPHISPHIPPEAKNMSALNPRVWKSVFILSTNSF